MRLVTSGFSNRELAKRCNLSQGTVKHHLTRIFAKLDVDNRLAPQTPLEYVADVVRKLLDYLADRVERFRGRHR